MLLIKSRSSFFKFNQQLLYCERSKYLPFFNISAFHRLTIHSVHQVIFLIMIYRDNMYVVVSFIHSPLFFKVNLAVRKKKSTNYSKCIFYRTHYPSLLVTNKKVKICQNMSQIKLYWIIIYRRQNCNI